MKEDKKYIGYLKYQGESVQDGLLDARKAGEALIGFDKILRYFLSKESPELAEIDFEIPVRIEKGSWVSLITEDIGSVICTLVVLRYGDVYLKEWFKKIARDGLYKSDPAEDINESFRKIMLIVCEIIKIYKHVGILEESKIENPDIQELDSGSSVKIINNKGEDLITSKDIYNYYKQCPVDLLSQNAEIIGDGDAMEVGVSINGKTTTETISDKEKGFFTRSKDSELERILPELKDGKKKTLEGKITRVNVDNNSIGFGYKDVIIECKPEQGGYISQFKNEIISTNKRGDIFQKVKITGIIDRIDGNGKQKRISIRIITIKAVKNQRELL